ncbi:hypothetical protein PVAP13_3KG162127 [Panicum virgatum]|uniref:Uncharacterized protein n=1 Tax=Panicum virgatum TaxID=38727 RepID=A0A8T0UV55_PANVG|nr:hypothetical protein PVAP13_3KG162127 [Panicum virgatum]
MKERSGWSSAAGVRCRRAGVDLIDVSHNLAESSSSPTAMNRHGTVGVWDYQQPLLTSGHKIIGPSMCLPSRPITGLLPPLVVRPQRSIHRSASSVAAPPAPATGIAHGWGGGGLLRR